MRPTLRAILLAALVLTNLVPSVAASGGRPISVEGPDVDGAYELTFEVVRAVGGEVRLGFDVHVARPSGNVTATRDLGAFEFLEGSNSYSASFLPIEGPGDYAVALVVNGAAGDSLQFTVTEGAGGSSAFRYEVPDEPTRIVLSSDSVNANGKTKSPGEGLVTRGTVSDGNGLTDVADWRVTVERANGSQWSVFDQSSLPWRFDEGTTSATFEHTFDRSPIPSGSYRLVLSARRDDMELASVNRTFVIREVAPTLTATPIADVTPDTNLTLTPTLIVSDRNGLDSTPLELRVYKTSTRMESAGFSALFSSGTNTTRLDAGAALQDEGGAARGAFDLQLRIPALATPGAHRVSVYAGGALLGTLPFEVRELPRIDRLSVQPEADALVIRANGTGEGVLRVEVHDGERLLTTTTARFLGGGADMRIDRSGASGALQWRVALQARDGGPVLSETVGTWNVTARELPLVVRAQHTSARTPGIWQFEAPGWVLTGAVIEAHILRWDGQPAAGFVADHKDGRLRIDGPADAAAGRYHVHVLLTLPNGTTGEAEWHFEAGPWLRLDVGAAVVDGRTARIPVTNSGGLTIARVVVQLEGAPSGADVEWERDGVAQPLVESGRRKHVLPTRLEPDASGTLVVRLPDGPLRSGAHETRVRVFALAGGSP